MSDIGSSHAPAAQWYGDIVIARSPVQERSQQRVAAVLAVAEQMIVARGPEATSIPDIAVEADVPRASIYQFFPTKYALFARIAEGHLEAVAEHVLRACEGHRDGPWRALFPRLVNAAADYYDAHPVAAILVLGGPTSEDDYKAQRIVIEHIAHELRRAITALPVRVRLPKGPDVASLAVEIAFACLKHGYFRERALSKAIRAEASRAAVAYIAAFERPAAPATRSSRR
jgi:AcrR family transcriptional regulator